MLLSFQRLGRAGRMVSVSFFLWGIGEGLYLYLMPLYLHQLGASPQQSGLALGMLGAGRLLTVIPLFFLINRYPPQRLMLPAWLCGVLGALVMGVATNWQVVALGLFITGVSWAATVPTNAYLLLAYHQDTTRHRQTPMRSLFAYYWAAVSAGLILSPAIGGLLGERFGLRLPILLSAGWFFLSFLTIYLAPRFAMQTHASDSRAFTSLWRDRPFILALLIFALLFIAGPMGFTLVPRFLEETHAYSTDTLGLLGTLTSLGAAVFSLLLGQRSAWPGFLGAAVLLMLSFGLFSQTSQLGFIALAYLLYGTWYALRPLATGLIAALLRPDQHGVGFTLLDLIYGIMEMSAPVIAGMLYASGAGMPFSAALILIGVGFIGALLWIIPNGLTEADSVAP